MSRKKLKFFLFSAITPKKSKIFIMIGTTKRVIVFYCIVKAGVKKKLWTMFCVFKFTLLTRGPILDMVLGFNSFAPIN